MAADERDDPEHEALEALARGDREAAFEALYRLYSARVRRHCRGLLRDDASAEDAWQVTFIEAHRDLLTFKGRGTLRSWLLGIATHRCLDIARKLRRIESRERPLDVLPRQDGEGAPSGAGGRPDPAAFDGAAECLARLSRQQLHALLQRGIEALDADDRVAVLLRFDSGLSYPEMATLLGEQAATLEARVRRAMVKLRRWIERQGVSDHDV